MFLLRNKEVKVLKQCQIFKVLGVCSSEAVIITVLAFCRDLRWFLAPLSISYLFWSFAYCHYDDGKPATQLQEGRKGEHTPPERGEGTRWVGGKNRKMIREAKVMQSRKKRTGGHKCLFVLWGAPIRWRDAQPKYLSSLYFKRKQKARKKYCKRDKRP